MTNDKIDFYLLTLTGDKKTLYISIDKNGDRNYMSKWISILAVKNETDESMTDVFTGKKIYKYNGELRPELTYTDARVANSSDLHDMVKYLDYIKEGYNVKEEVKRAFTELEEEKKSRYDAYLYDLTKLTEFYVDNMNEFSK